VFRDLDLVVVTTSSSEVGDERRDHRRQIFELVERLILTPTQAPPFAPAATGSGAY
jgi:hypothetical protein